MNIPENLPEQLKLALSILSARREYITDSQATLLGIEGTYDLDDIRSAAEEVLFEIIMSCFPHEEPKIDLQEVAVELLKRIAVNGGVLHRDKVGLPDQLVNQLEKDGIVRKSVGGLVWGKFARKAIADFESEKNK